MWHFQIHIISIASHLTFWCIGTFSPSLQSHLTHILLNVRRNNVNYASAQHTRGGWVGFRLTTVAMQCHIDCCVKVQVQSTRTNRYNWISACNTLKWIKSFRPRAHTLNILNSNFVYWFCPCRLFSQGFIAAGRKILYIPNEKINTCKIK